MAVAATKPLPKFDRVMTMDTPRAVGDLAMTDQNGAPRRISDLVGAPTLVFFGSRIARMFARPRFGNSH